MSALRSRGFLVLLVILGAFLVVVVASRTWLTGSVDDVVLGATSVDATGAEAAGGVVALVLTALAVVAGLASIARVLLDPGAVLGPIAAAAAGRSGSLETHSSVNAWPWVALLGFVVAGLALAGLTRVRRVAPGLSSRYEAPGRAPESDWDQLTAGEDPTDVGQSPRT